MKLIVFLTLFPSLLIAESYIQPKIECSSLKSFKLGGTSKIIEAKKQGDICRVDALLDKTIEYSIVLPLDTWTGRYLQLGCQDLCQTKNPKPAGAYECEEFASNQLAVARSNLGYSADNKDWGNSPKNRINFAVRALEISALASRSIAKKFYGAKPFFSYFSGCREGGREALILAKQHPNLFDGILAGAPLVNFASHQSIFTGWMAQLNKDNILTEQKISMLHEAVLEKCDEQDGVKDELVSNPLACKFKPRSLLCARKDRPTCLTKEQVKIAENVYKGPISEAGKKRLSPGGLLPGSELAWSAAFSSAKETAERAVQNFLLENGHDDNWSTDSLIFSLEEFKKLNKFSGVYDASDHDLSEFTGANGKLILWHGWTDAFSSPKDTLSFYSQLRKRLGEAWSESTTRLYMLPGENSCGNVKINLLSKLIAWVEKNTAPNHVRFENRFILPFPEIAIYKGEGDKDVFSNYTLKTLKSFKPKSWARSKQSPSTCKISEDKIFCAEY